MMLPFVLWGIGLGLIFLEFYLPGAIMGTLGGILIGVSLVLFVQESHSLFFVSAYFVAVGLSVGALIKYALWRIPRANPEDSIYSDDSQSGFYASSFDPLLIGREGIVFSDLKPGGYITIDGKQHPAISESGYLVSGDAVVVLRGEGDSLIVMKK